MPDGLEIIPVRGIGEVLPGTDLAEAIASAAPWLRDGDVLVVTSKIVSKAEGRLVDVPVSGPEREAARDELLAAETARSVARRGRTRIVQTHHGFVLASAGIDASNVERSRLVLLPKDPDASARGLRSALKERTGLNVAVIVSDTMGRPWRNGLTDVALGAAGLEAVRDYRGEIDAYGNELHITQMAVADELAAAADLVKGKRDQVPVAVVRGFLTAMPAEDGAGAVVLLREPGQDLFPLGTAEAHAAGVLHAAGLVDAPDFGEATDRSRPARPTRCRRRSSGALGAHWPRGLGSRWIHEAAAAPAGRIRRGDPGGDDSHHPVRRCRIRGRPPNCSHWASTFTGSGARSLPRAWPPAGCQRQAGRRWAILAVGRLGQRPLRTAVPSGVIECTTMLRSRWLVISPALRRTVACWLAAAAETPIRRESSLVVHPSPTAASAAARVLPSRAPSARRDSSGMPLSAAGRSAGYTSTGGRLGSRRVTG